MLGLVWFGLFVFYGILIFEGYFNTKSYSYILFIHRILEAVRTKNLEATILFVDFAKAFDSIHRRKMEQILLAYSLPKETVAAIMMLYRNTKVKVRSIDGDTDYFDIVAGVLQGDTLVPFLFIICLDYVIRMSIDKMKDNGFKQKIPRTYHYGCGLRRWHSAFSQYTRPSRNPAT